MKKALLVGLLLTTTLSTPYNFEIWNKTKDPIYFELGTDQELGKDKKPSLGKNLIPVNAFGKKETLFTKGTRYGVIPTLQINVQQDYAQAMIDPQQKQKTVILLSRGETITDSKPGALITLNPGKDIVLELKEDPTGKPLFVGDNRKYVLTPQVQVATTPGYSQHAMRLKFNVTNADITILDEEANKKKKLIEKELKERKK